MDTYTDNTPDTDTTAYDTLYAPVQPIAAEPTEDQPAFAGSHLVTSSYSIGVADQRQPFFQQWLSLAQQLQASHLQPQQWLSPPLAQQANPYAQRVAPYQPFTQGLGVTQANSLTQATSLAQANPFTQVYQGHCQGLGVSLADYAASSQANLANYPGGSLAGISLGSLAELPFLSND